MCIYIFLKLLTFVLLTERSKQTIIFCTYYFKYMFFLTIYCIIKFQFLFYGSTKFDFHIIILVSTGYFCNIYLFFCEITLIWFKSTKYGRIYYHKDYFSFINNQCKFCFRFHFIFFLNLCMQIS